jgi:Zn-dependent peptidase ImmA (M78 family)
MLQLSSLCDQYGDDNSDPEIKRIERFCNSVAGATLVPTHFLLKEDVIRNKLSSKNWTDIDIELLAQKYKVSREVIVRRLLTLNLTDENFYNAKREQYNREYKDNIERQKKTEKLEKQKSFKKNIARNVISNSGKTYVKLVLSAYHSKKISIKDVLDYFGGIKLEQLSKIKQYIYG